MHFIVLSKQSCRHPSIFDMEPSCSQSDPQITPQTTEEKMKHRNECDRGHYTAETVEHRLSVLPFAPLLAQARATMQHILLVKYIITTASSVLHKVPSTCNLLFECIASN